MPGRNSAPGILLGRTRPPTSSQIKPSRGAALISLYNLYPSASVIGTPAPGFSSGQAIELMDEVANRTLPPGTTYEWTTMSYQETIVGNQLLYVFILAIVLVYLCLAGQYESWIAPFGVILYLKQRDSIRIGGFTGTPRRRRSANRRRRG